MANLQKKIKHIKFDEQKNMENWTSREKKNVLDILIENIHAFEFLWMIFIIYAYWNYRSNDSATMNFFIVCIWF